MLVNMKEILKDAVKNNRSVAAFNVFGYEDAKAVIEAAEECNAPVILMTNKDAREFMDVEYYAKLFGAMAKNATVPVCIHLDHAKDYYLIARAIKAGYTSVMYDGSQLPLEENIKNTKEVVKLANACDISVEAEIGSVAYSDKNLDVKSIYTEPNEAEYFAKETKVHALAVAIGTIHRMQVQEAKIQYDRLEKITKLIDTPIVIHGSTGVKDEDLQKLTKYRVGKVNIGTALRMAFANTLRKEMENNPEVFDRIKLFKRPMEEVKKAAINKVKLLGW
ncbi:class II fructose-bisphosphate aldolase [Schnuerera ultunensis]|uniref:Tagatose-bisphosphate aldolase (Modular protein) n=1 Tax=[Clostridium] ultunense Esp TaxID=1288971 RepID=A0A1M4PL53_9FIRM|nr:class II fructose-bisphosphate aldolase [Schnuerera ultunensis]SHD76203.1 Tagatose-bisphosphate aldolase (Modular protein) [[Clostridium] ultunense Esp]